VIAFENIVLSGREQEVSEYERRKPNRKSDYNIRSTFSSENNRKIGNVNRSVSVVYKKKTFVSQRFLINFFGKNN